jgi:hypothetical protein
MSPPDCAQERDVRRLRVLVAHDADDAPEIVQIVVEMIDVGRPAPAVSMPPKIRNVAVEACRSERRDELRVSPTVFRVPVNDDHLGAGARALPLVER